MVECIEQLPKIKYMLDEKLRDAGNLLRRKFLHERLSCLPIAYLPL
jgi:hypothetical protein